MIAITGATGLVGNAIARRLAAAGEKVRALVRDPARAEELLPGGVELVRGDVTDPASLPPLVRGAELVFHAAGMPEQWARDEAIFDRVNRQGTRSVLEAAREAGVRRAVYTSTMDVFAAPPGGTLVETALDGVDKPTAYERSKALADREAEAVRAKGLEVVHLCPSAVYGPSPVHVALNSFFLQVLKKEAPLVPPKGMSVAYVDGVADAHLAAAARGVSGERYLLSDAYVSNHELATRIAKAGGLPKAPPTAPYFLLATLAYASAPFAKLFGLRPLLSLGQLAFLRWDVRVDARKAEASHGFRPTPVADGVARTVSFLVDQGLAPRRSP